METFVDAPAGGNVFSGIVPGGAGAPMVNLFGNMTIIHQQQFQPRNPMMEQMRLMSDMANRNQQIMLQQQQMQLEQARLAIEAKKIDVIQQLADNQLKLGPGEAQSADIPVIGNPEKLAIAANVTDTSTEEAEDVEFEVRDTNKPVVSVKDAEIVQDIVEPAEEKQPEYEITEDRIFYDFSPYSDYINLKKFFNESDGSVQDWLKDEIDNTDAGKNRIYCDSLGSPAVVFIKSESASMANLTDYWRIKFRKIYERYEKSVFKSPNITAETDFVIFIMDPNYEFMHVINLIPCRNLARFTKTDLSKEVVAWKTGKPFMNFIRDNNSLVENRRIKSAVIIAEPVLPRENAAKTITFDPDNLLSNIGIESAFESRKFYISLTEYTKKIYEIYNLHS